MKRFLFLFTLSMLALMAAPAASFADTQAATISPIQWLGDPGFELNDGSWSRFGFLFYQTGLAYEGSYAMISQVDGSLKYIEQNVIVSGTAGDSYTLTFYVGGRNITNDGQLGTRLNFYSPAGNNTRTCGVGDRGSFGWRQVTCTGTATNDYNRIQVLIGWQDVTSGTHGYGCLFHTIQTSTV